MRIQELIGIELFAEAKVKEEVYTYTRIYIHSGLFSLCPISN